MTFTKIRRQPLYRDLGLFTSLGYIFFSVIPHATAPRYIFAGLMLVVLTYQIYRNQLQKPGRDAVTISLLVLCVIVLVSAIFTPYDPESLWSLRKDTLPFLVAFVLLTCQKTNVFEQTRVAAWSAGALIGGYTIKLSLAIWLGINNGWNFSFYENADESMRDLFLFAADIPYFLPFVAATLLFSPLNTAIRGILGLVTMLTLAFAFMSGVRTSFVFVVGTCLLLIFVRFWSQKGKLALIMGACFVAGYLALGQMSDQIISRYSSIFSTDTYKFGKDGSVTVRRAIASAVWEIDKDRPWLGYGPGWKKLPIVAEQAGYMAHWKQGGEAWHESALAYFSTGEGRVNPHNFYLMVLFEVGALGLAAYLAMLGALMTYCVAGAWSKYVSKEALGIYLASFCYVVVYLGAGLSGGPWLPTTLLVAAASVVLCRKASQA